MIKYKRHVRVFLALEENRDDSDIAASDEGRSRRRYCRGGGCNQVGRLCFLQGPKKLAHGVYKYLIALLFFSTSLAGDELTIDPPEIWPSICSPCRPPEPPLSLHDPEEDVCVDLVDPLYTEGTLSTEAGGVLTAQNLRIQARKIHCVRRLKEDVPIFTVDCEGDLIIDYGERVLVGDRLYYDFLAHRGFLTNGRTASPPWYIGGREMLLMEEGKVIVIDGFLTTSEGETKDIVLTSSYICLTPDRLLSAKNIQFCVNSVPCFWFPQITLDLKNIDRPPLAIQYGWGGFLGSYVSLLYRFLSWRDLKATARFDAFFGKGVGLGIETVYNPSSRPTEWYSRNYYAHDIALDTPRRKNRYRFQGTFYDRVYGVTINGMYDFVSDGQMAADYQTKDFDLKTAGNTQLLLTHKEPSWIANLFTNMRVNHFQTVNQQLPSFLLNWHPFKIPGTGILCENEFKASYYRYVFSNDVDVNNHPFASSRIATHPFFYRPCFFGPLTLTPEAGFIGIAYGNSPSGKAVYQAAAELGARLDTALTRTWSTWKHVLEPYLDYTYLSAPHVATDHHFIFSINDGIDRLNLVRCGMRNSLFHKIPCALTRPLWIDLWTNVFFHTPTLPQSIPRGYLDIEWSPTPRVLCTANTAWNFQEHQLDFYNVRFDWTFNMHFASAIEYRHRSRFDWLKADFYNFVLDSVRTTEKLLSSHLSDRRDTLLFRIFARLNPDWIATFDWRSGWNRILQPPYHEYQIEVSRVIFQHWRATFKFEKRESDNRFTCSLLLDPGPPSKRKTFRSIN
jgi:hypothetical protein